MRVCRKWKLKGKKVDESIVVEKNGVIDKYLGESWSYYIEEILPFGIARFIEAVEGLNYVLNGDQEHCLPSTVNISFRGVDAEGVFLAMKESYAFSNGSACNSGYGAG